MPNYTIRAVNQELIEHHNFEFDVQMYQAYDFTPVVFSPREPINKGFVTIGETDYYLTEDKMAGFVVKKVYKENPDEPDPVLRQWGDYSNVSIWGAQDSRLQDWLSDQINLHLNLHGLRAINRLRSFGPRRSKKFHPKISLWLSQQHRDEDSLTAMKPARAISRMFPELDHKQLIQVTDAYLQEFAPRDLTLFESFEAEDFKLAYAGKQSEYENIQTTGGRKSLASSCMRYDFDHLPRHPAEMYASGDFYIVYTKDQHGAIGSRCVVYKTEDGPNQAGPIYGVSEQSIDMIHDHLVMRDVDTVSDTTRDPSWEGAKLLRVEHDGGFIGPYLDLQPQNVRDTGKYLEVDSVGCIDASVYQGVLGEHFTECCNCEESLTEDEYHYSEYNGMHYCESCYHEDHVFCDYYEEMVHVDQAIECKIVSYGCTRTILVYEGIVEDGDFFVFCRDRNHWHVDDVVYSEYDELWLSPNDMDDYFQSDWDGEFYPNKQLCVLADGNNVSRDELDQDTGIWQLNAINEWEQIQEEMELDA